MYMWFRSRSFQTAISRPSAIEPGGKEAFELGLALAKRKIQTSFWQPIRMPIVWAMYVKDTKSGEYIPADRQYVRLPAF